MDKKVNRKVNNITYGIVGLGIMGGSIAKAIKTNILNDKESTGSVIALDKNTDSLNNALISNAIDKGFLPEQTTTFLSLCDFVFICLYPHSIINFLKQNKKYFKDNSIITDISGVKSELEDNIEDIKPNNADLIFGHPMAGGAKEGYVNSKSEYFKNHNYILIPHNFNKKENLILFEELIYKMGFSKIITTDSKTHDEKIAFTSQLCHVLASAMVETADDIDITSFAGGSFDDFTRIAMINAPLWTELFLSNKKELIKHIDKLKENLNSIEELIQSDNSKELEALLNDVRQKRIQMK
ncbi:MAG: prephenate dehydrogenase [Treponema sp.]|jgi:prephenate dehydrogenase|nr:prephenate dehydrogenase [Treponema sp.]